MAPLPKSGNPISMLMIFEEFGPNRTNGNGYEFDDYTGTAYWLNDYPYSEGKFTTTQNNLTLADFYGKRGTDPVQVGTTIFNSSAAFQVPSYRTSVRIECWAGGGGGGGSTYKWGGEYGPYPANASDGNLSSVTVRHTNAVTVITSNGGERGFTAEQRGGEIRGGNAGTRSIITTPSDHSPIAPDGGNVTSGSGGGADGQAARRVGICTNGGRGGDAKDGSVPGGLGGDGGQTSGGSGGRGGSNGTRRGGGGGGAGYCFNKGKSSTGASGGGSGAYASQSFATNKRQFNLTNSYEGLVPGQKITIVVGAGGAGGGGGETTTGGAGGAGQVIITWK